MKEIQLTMGYIALVDDEDYERINSLKWFAAKRRRTVYAYRNKNTKSPVHYAMHRMILDVADMDVIVDHINGNGLDNRKENLRLGSKSQNNANRRKYGRTRYKGVSLQNQTGKWRAYIKINGKQEALGCYTTRRAAARAYDRRAKQLFGPFAFLNFPDQKAA